MIGSFLVFTIFLGCSIWAYFHKNEVAEIDIVDSSEVDLTTIIFSPLIAGYFYYYGWKTKYPKKSNLANNLSWIMLIPTSVIYTVLNAF